MRLGLLFTVGATKGRHYASQFNTYPIRPCQTCKSVVGFDCDSREPFLSAGWQTLNSTSLYSRGSLICSNPRLWKVIEGVGRDICVIPLAMFFECAKKVVGDEDQPVDITANITFCSPVSVVKTEILHGRTGMEPTQLHGLNPFWGLLLEFCPSWRASQHPAEKSLTAKKRSTPKKQMVPLVNLDKWAAEK